MVSAETKQPIFKPWVVLNKSFKATDAGGKAVDVTLKVGVIGFAPPPILQWDKANLEGHVEVTGWKETAARYVPEMKAAGADLIVALAHGGIDLKTPYSASMENGAAYLTQVPGIDALITGHQHLLFPDTNPKSQFAGQPGIDLAKGLINGVPAVQAGQWGNNLGQIKLRLAYDKGWSVQKDATQVQRISTRLTAQSGNTPATYVAPDAATQQLVQVEHAATIAYVKTPIGAAQFDMSTYYAMAGDVSALQIVNMAQIDYLKDYIARNNPPHAAPAHPVGGRAVQGRTQRSRRLHLRQAGQHRDQQRGRPVPVSQHAAGGARQRRHRAPVAGEDGRAVPPDRPHPGGAAGPGRHDLPHLQFRRAVCRGQYAALRDRCHQAGGLAHRQPDLQGRPAQSHHPVPGRHQQLPRQRRRRLPGLAGGKGDIVLQAPDASRDVLISYIKRHPSLDLATYGLDRSWRFVKLAGQAGPVVFASVPGTLAMATAHGVGNVSVHDATPDPVTQLSRYKIDLTQ